MTSPLHFPGMSYLIGPYSVDYTDIEHDGNAKTLWTPAIGDVIVTVFGDTATLVQCDNSGGLNTSGIQFGTAAEPTQLSGNSLLGFLSFQYAYYNNVLDTIPSRPILLPYIVRSTSPFQLKYHAGDDGNLTAGHIDLYALICRGPST